MPPKNRSPLRYPGGKTRAISILDSYVQTYFPNRTHLLSPFFGGGSFELYMTSKGYSVDANDLFLPLYLFWTIQQTDCDALIQTIRDKMPVTKESFQEMRASILTDMQLIPVPSHRIAAMYFLINRCSFSGATLCGGFSKQAAEKRLTESSLQRLKECNVSNITFANMNAVDFLQKHPEHEHTLVYADPPYYIESYIYGKDGDLHESFDHVAFATEIKKRTDWILSYNDCSYIRELYNDCRIFEVKWAYGMNCDKKSSEVIILPPE